jgi:alpha-beta hydrolase superfamily lysophospholipase
MCASVEKTVELDDATQIHLRIGAAKTPSKLAICLVHGLGEHSGRYQHVIDYFNERSISVVSFDLRGHGLSSGPRGTIPNYETILDDMRQLIELTAREFPAQPLALYGHSLGGNFVINYCLRRDLTAPRIARAVASSPLLRTTHLPPRWKTILGQIMNRIWPTFCLDNGVDLRDLSREPAVAIRFRSDSLNHKRLSARLGISMLESGEWALHHAHRLTIPLLLLHGDADQITSSAASRQFADRAGALCEFRMIEGGFHELHHDLDRHEFLVNVADWLLSENTIMPKSADSPKS